MQVEKLWYLRCRQKYGTTKMQLQLGRLLCFAVHVRGCCRDLLFAAAGCRPTHLEDVQHIAILLSPKQKPNSWTNQKTWDAVMDGKAHSEGEQRRVSTLQEGGSWTADTYTPTNFRIFFILNHPKKNLWKITSVYYYVTYKYSEGELTRCLLYKNNKL